MGIRGGGAGIRGGGAGIKGRGSGYKGRGRRRGGIQHQEYIMTINLNIGRRIVLSCYISFHQRTRFRLEFNSLNPHAPLD